MALGFEYECGTGIAFLELLGGLCCTIYLLPAYDKYLNCLDNVTVDDSLFSQMIGHVPSPDRKKNSCRPLTLLIKMVIRTRKSLPFSIARPSIGCCYRLVRCCTPSESQYT